VRQRADDVIEHREHDHLGISRTQMRIAGGEFRNEFCWKPSSSWLACDCANIVPPAG
jgi:hypothetical protein